MKLTSYLFFNGEAEEAAHFYANALGGKVGDIYRYNTMPAIPGITVPEECKQFITHVNISFPGGLMSVADTLPSDKRNFGNKGHMLTLYCESIAQTEEVYAKLTEGAQEILCELGEVFFAKRYAEVLDRYGVLWAIMFDEN